MGDGSLLGFDRGCGYARQSVDGERDVVIS